MRIDGKWHRTLERHGEGIRVIDQRMLPHRLDFVDIRTHAEACEAIRNMTVRGAGLIGATAAWGMAVAARAEGSRGVAGFNAAMSAAGSALVATRPTASNLSRAVKRSIVAMDAAGSVPEKVQAAFMTAVGIADEDAAFCRRIGRNALPLLRTIHERKRVEGGDPTVHVLTHCNAGWLAFTDFGSALAPVYAAAAEGIPVHVWVDETRPRGQGAALTAFELGAAGIPHDLVADNAGGHLMRLGMVDVCLVGADRVVGNGDAANKIGTYLKALAAHDNGIPFYVLFPASTIDWDIGDGRDIPIEERAQDEERYAVGRLDGGDIGRVLICPERTQARNFGFDVTPARLITGCVTERGVCDASEAGLRSLYPEGAACGPGEAPSAEDGVVRFAMDWMEAPVPVGLHGTAAELDGVRRPLHHAGMIGEQAGIGYGNISARVPEEYGAFLISGTATGGFDSLGPDRCAVVEASIPAENLVLAYGRRAPSSESMTHAAVYAADSSVGGVVHVHCRALFERLRDGGTVPAIPSHVGYGTPSLASAVADVVERNPGLGLFVTLGHQDGVFAYGPDAQAASDLLKAVAD